MTFEEDYFGMPVGVFDEDAVKLAESFLKDPFKSPEQQAQAKDYLNRVAP